MGLSTGVLRKAGTATLEGEGGLVVDLANYVTGLDVGVFLAGLVAVCSEVVTYRKTNRI